MKIVDLCAYAPKSAIKAGEAIKDGKYMFFTSSDDESKRYSDYQHNCEAIIMGTGGNATLHYYNGKFSTSTDCIVLLPNESIRCKFLYYFFLHNIAVLQKGFKGAGLKHTNKNYINNIGINTVPDIETQDKVIKALDLACNLVRFHQQQLKKLDELVKSRFIEMIQPLFEAGQTEPMNNLIRSDRPVTYGILKPGTDIPGGIPVVRVKDYPNGVIIEEDMLHTTPEIDAKYTRSHLIAGDLLLSIGGSIGRMAIVPASLEGANITQHTARLSFGNRALPLYVRGVIEMPYMQDLIASLVKGVAQKGIELIRC